ncbi:MAG: hypothetical protein M0Z60_06335 [Nitrospiraceae bacterium]|nr:hypothetical protein [Nitrospiraceae bacterium]
MVSSLDDLKQKIFYDMLGLAGRVFILARYSADVVIGNRGFLPEEKEKGIVLVFNKRMSFEWTDSGISAQLVFGAETHQCHIPHDSIISVFSPELSAQFVVSPASVTGEKEAGKPKKKPEVPEKPARAATEKVVRVDFNRKK